MRSRVTGGYPSLVLGSVLCWGLSAVPGWALHYDELPSVRLAELSVTHGCF